MRGKTNLEGFLLEQGLRYDQLKEAQFKSARGDARLSIAEDCFKQALELAEQDGLIGDAAIARHQLGLLYHARGDLKNAHEYILEAMKVLINIPGEMRSSHMSGCHYHLGIIAWRQGRTTEAMRELQQSRSIDEAEGDISGVLICDEALATCEQTAGVVPARSDSESWAGDPEILTRSEASDDSEGGEWAPLEEPRIERADVKSDHGGVSGAQAQPVFNQREVIILASHSDEGNNKIMNHLEAIAGEFGRTINVLRVAYGSDDPSHQLLPSLQQDQHLCAVILVLECVGIESQQFQALALNYMDRVSTMPDFRLLVYLHDLTIEELRERADNSYFLERLFDTTQIAASPSLDQLRGTLVPFLSNVERLVVADQWRRFKLKLAVGCSYVAFALLVLASSVGLLSYAAPLFKDKLGEYIALAPPFSSFLLGLLVFPTQSRLFYHISRGIGVGGRMLSPRENRKLAPWLFGGLAVLIGASRLQVVFQGPYAWIWPGLAIGVLLDSIRRAGFAAKREKIDLAKLISEAKDVRLREPDETVARDASENPFKCPLIPAVTSRIFLSYTRSSSRASRFASALFVALKEVGAAPFLDRASIPEGASWRRALNRNIGECDTFVCILDEKGVCREWVAAEVLSALKANRVAGTPNVLLLVDPMIDPKTPDVLPLFQGIIEASKMPMVQGRPQIIMLNEKTRSTLSWLLAPGRFPPPAVFVGFLRVLFMQCLRLPVVISIFGTPVGLVLGFMAFLAITGKFPLVDKLSALGCLIPVTLCTCFWLGSNSRTAVAWAFERRHEKKISMTLPVLSCVGLVYVLFLCMPMLDALSMAWAAFLLPAGWIMVAFIMRNMGATDQLD